MTTHVQVELFGGPQDGRVITLPAASEGQPLPVPVPRDELDIDGNIVTAPEGQEDLEIAWYERYCWRDGGWVYRYTDSHRVHPEWPEDYSSSTLYSSEG